MDSQMNVPRHSEMNSQSYSQPFSQLPSQNFESARRNKGKNIDTIEKASWDSRSSEIFIQLCVKELMAGNRPGTHFNKNGWENIVKSFAQTASRKYTRIQLKNRWDSLKKEWGAWKKMLNGETGLGCNHERGTKDASHDWWQKRIQANPEVAKFRERGPTLIHEQEMLFSDVVATGANAWTPSSGVLPPHMQEEPDEVETHGAESDPTDDLDTSNPMVNDIGSNEGPRRKSTQFARIHHKKAKRMTTAEKIARCLERMVNSIEGASESSPSYNNSGRKYTIQECLEILEHILGIEEGDPLWMYATRLFLKPFIRELFLTIKKDNIRLKWLQEQMERDMCRRASSNVSVQASHGDSRDNDNASSH